MTDATRPVTVLIGALGGEGGGVLSNWLVDAATTEGLTVQATSVPGVAQRTGATTYYLEIGPKVAPGVAPQGRDGSPAAIGAGAAPVVPPVMALLPSPGNVDLLVASELLEAGRAAQSGMLTPERTTLIASTHRFYSIGEKSAMSDGRFDTARIVETVRALTKHCVLADLSQTAERSGAVINSVLYGAMAATGVLPLSRQALEGAIERGAVAVEANLRGFAAGFELAAQCLAEGPTDAVPPGPREEALAAGPKAITARVRAMPEIAHPVVELGLARTAEYQSQRYAQRYLDRVERVLVVDRAHGGASQSYALTRETARYLALWMTYEDVIRVADLKTRRARHDRVRAEVRAGPDQPLVITEFLKPGVDEWCALLPTGLARAFRGAVRGLGIEEKLSVGLHVKTTTISGFLSLWLLARARWWRPFSSRFGDEQMRIESWLDRVADAVRVDYDLALEVVQCANLVKGYGDTHRRGRSNFDRIMGALASCERAAQPAVVVKRLREAALSDPEGKALQVAFRGLEGKA